EIDDEVVEAAPVDVLEKLPDRRHLHRSPPDNWRTRIRQHECHRHHREVQVGAYPHGQDGFSPDGWPLLLETQHLWDIRPVDIEIEKANLIAAIGESEGKIYRDGRLADSPFAAQYQDYMLDIKFGFRGKPPDPIR